MSLHAGLGYETDMLPFACKNCEISRDRLTDFVMDLGMHNIDFNLVYFSTSAPAPHGKVERPAPGRLGVGTR